MAKCHLRVGHHSRSKIVNKRVRRGELSRVASKKKVPYMGILKSIADFCRQKKLVEIVRFAWILHEKLRQVKKRELSKTVPMAVQSSRCPPWENWNRFLYFVHKKLLVALCSRRLEMRVWSLQPNSCCLSGARLTPDWSGLPFYFFKQQFITSCTIVGLVIKTLPLSSLWPSCGGLEIQIEVQPKLESFDCLTTFAVFPCIQL